MQKPKIPMPEGVTINKSAWYKTEIASHTNVTGWFDYSVMALFILPRLIMLRDETHGHPPEFTQPEWLAMLNEMVFAMSYFSEGAAWQAAPCDVPEGEKQPIDRARDGAALMGKYFDHLWD